MPSKFVCFSSPATEALSDSGWVSLTAVLYHKARHVAGVEGLPRHLLAPSDAVSPGQANDDGPFGGDHDSDAPSFALHALRGQIECQVLGAFGVVGGAVAAAPCTNLGRAFPDGRPTHDGKHFGVALLTRHIHTKRQERQ